MQIMNIDLLGNIHPLKLDRNLQWMPQHPTKLTYNLVLSWTMTQLSASFKTAPPIWLNQTHTHKSCVSDISHTAYWHCKNVYSDYSNYGSDENGPQLPNTQTTASLLSKCYKVNVNLPLLPLETIATKVLLDVALKLRRTK